MATHTSILAWRIPWTGTWQATVHGVARVRRDFATRERERECVYVNPKLPVSLPSRLVTLSLCFLCVEQNS